jgi:hypothetical protein
MSHHGLEAKESKGWSWARSLLLVARASASGTLGLRAHGRAASIRISHGAVVGFEGDLGPRIGELIGARDGGQEGAAPLAWGVQAVAEGRVSRSDLAWALRKQLRLRAKELWLWGDVDATWEAGPPEARPFTDPMDPCDLVAEAIRAAAQRQPPTLPTRERAETLTTLGAWWVDRAALFPHEAAAVRGELRSGAAIRFARAARLAGLLEVPVTPEARELTRVHAAVRRDGPDVMLGDPRDHAARRRRMRQLASAVHPDRFARDPDLGRISHELVSTLTERARAR